MFLLPGNLANFETWNLVCRLGGRVVLSSLLITIGCILSSESVFQLQCHEIINIKAPLLVSLHISDAFKISKKGC